MKQGNYFKYKNNIKRAPYFFLLPNMLIFSIFVIIPTMMGIFYSFTNFKGVGKAEWVGISNYIKIIKDIRLHKVFGNTFVFSFFSVLLIYVISLLLAYILSSQIKGKSFFRAAYYWPSMIAPVVIGVMWKWILNDNFGAVNLILQQIGVEPILILSTGKLAKMATILIKVWFRCGFYMIILMGGLLSIPDNLYEAAKVDGANKIKQFFLITLPLLKPTSLVIIILGTIDMIKTYPLVLNLTGGGPANSTMLIVQYVYETGFIKYQYGYASAISIILLIIITIVSVINFSLGSRNER